MWHGIPVPRKTRLISWQAARWCGGRTRLRGERLANLTLLCCVSGRLSGATSTGLKRQMGLQVTLPGMLSTELIVKLIVLECNRVSLLRLAMPRSARCMFGRSRWQCRTSGGSRHRTAEVLVVTASRLVLRFDSWLWKLILSRLKLLISGRVRVRSIRFLWASLSSWLVCLTSCMLSLPLSVVSRRSIEGRDRHSVLVVCDSALSPVVK